MSMSCKQSSAGEYYLFVGTYTDETSEGIYLFTFNADDGSLIPRDTVTGVENPSYLALSPDHSFLYAVNEMADSAEATVSSFSFDRQKGELAFLNRQSSRGGAPCYVSVDAEGRAVFVANYLGGSLAMLPVKGDGSLEEAKVVVEHQGSSINKRRQKSPHMHCTYISQDNDMLFAADLGTDSVKGYAFDSGSMELNKDPSVTFNAEAGAGPRHLTFHPDGKFAYLINELNGTIVVFGYDGESLEPLQTVSTLPENYEGAVSGADIHVSPDGRFLYASNREELNNIVIYSIDEQNGKLTKAGQQPSGGVHPRNFMIDPTGRYLLAANRHTDNIVVFRRDEETGMLTPTGVEAEVSQPVSLQMVPIE